MGKKLDLALGILNGTIGDYLSRTENGLATSMEVVKEGRSVALDRTSLARAFPGAGPKIALLVHGLMCTESVWDLPGGGDYGAFLERDLGYTPLQIRYNSGRSIPDNGALLDALLRALEEHWPVHLEEILPLGFSMGGLVVRSACHVAATENHPWLSRVKRAFYVGTPHLGAPLERLGRVAIKLLRAIDDPYVRLVHDIAEMRSDGVKDLGDADLRHDDRARRLPRMGIRDPRHPVPLLPAIRHYLVAGSLSLDERLAALFGDGMVPLPSGTNGHVDGAQSIAFPPGHVKVVPGVAHMTLAHHPAVYETIRAWCEED